MFIDLLNAGKIESTTVDCSQTTSLLKLLDTVVIKLEGGTEEDLEFLEKEYKGSAVRGVLMEVSNNWYFPEMEAKYREQKEKEAAAEKAREAKAAEEAKKKEVKAVRKLYFCSKENT